MRKLQPKPNMIVLGMLVIRPRTNLSHTTVTWLMPVWTGCTYTQVPIFLMVCADCNVFCLLVRTLNQQIQETKICQYSYLV